MCGQGFMLAPGIGEVMTRFILEELSGSDKEVLHELRLDIQFSSEEALK